MRTEYIRYNGCIIESLKIIGGIVKYYVRYYETSLRSYPIMKMTKPMELTEAKMFIDDTLIAEQNDRTIAITEHVIIARAHENRAKRQERRVNRNPVN